MTLTSRVFGMTGLKMEDTVEWHADANFCRAPSFMLDRMQDPDNFEDFRHAGMPPLLNPSFERDVDYELHTVVRLEFPDRGLPRLCCVNAKLAQNHFLKSFDAALSMATPRKCPAQAMAIPRLRDSSITNALPANDCLSVEFYQSLCIRCGCLHGCRLSSWHPRCNNSFTVGTLTYSCTRMRPRLRIRPRGGFVQRGCELSHREVVAWFRL